MRCLLLLVTLLALGACNPLSPSETGSPDGIGKKEGNVGLDVPEADGEYHFAVSGSSTDPLVDSGVAQEGPVDLYLWLVSTNLGFSALECDIAREGAELAETYFTPDEGVLFMTWPTSGEVDLVVGGCPTSFRLLGTIHLIADGGPMTVHIVPDSEWAGAVDCHPIEAWIHPFDCIPFTAE